MYGEVKSNSVFPSFTFNQLFTIQKKVLLICYWVIFVCIVEKWKIPSMWLIEFVNRQNIFTGVEKICQVYLLADNQFMMDDELSTSSFALVFSLTGLLSQMSQTMKLKVSACMCVCVLAEIQQEMNETFGWVNLAWWLLALMQTEQSRMEVWHNKTWCNMNVFQMLTDLKSNLGCSLKSKVPVHPKRRKVFIYFCLWHFKKYFACDQCRTKGLAAAH